MRISTGVKKFFGGDCRGLFVGGGQKLNKYVKNSGISIVFIIRIIFKRHP